MKITLVRHAQIVEKYVGKYYGHLDMPLSKNGHQQAKNLAKKLKNEQFDKIYCSDLQRAVQTLDAFEFTQEIIYTKELREKSWGIHEGKSFEEIEATGIKYENFEQWLDALDGESMKDYKQRVYDCFYQTIATSDANNILVITHLGVIKTFISLYNNIPLEEAFAETLNYTEYITLDFF